MFPVITIPLHTARGEHNFTVRCLYALQSWAFHKQFCMQQGTFFLNPNSEKNYNYDNYYEILTTLNIMLIIMTIIITSIMIIIQTVILTIIMTVFMAILRQ